MTNTMQSLDDILRDLHQLELTPPATTQHCPLHLAVGHVLACDILAAYDLPHDDVSAMDGYALGSSATQNNTSYQVVGYCAAGDDSNVRLSAEQACRVLTGAMVPAGTFAVIPQEKVVLSDHHGVTTLQTTHSVKPEQHIRRTGTEQKAGTLLAGRGQRLQTHHIGQLAAQGLSSVQVYTPLTIGVMSTGNELIQPGTARLPGQIFDANRPQLLAMVQHWGGKALDLGLVPDDLDTTTDYLEEASHRCDLIISSGGASVGDADYLRLAVNRLGHIDHWQVAMKPGKPIAVGQVLGKPIVCLPGNPVAAYVTFYLLASLIIRRASGELIDPQWPSTIAYQYPLTQAITPGEQRRQLLRGRRVFHQGQWCVALHPDQGSANLQGLAQSDVLVDIPEGHGYAAFDAVRCYPLSELL